MQKIEKAVIAVAGSGTRLLPATKSMPKEMLPIINKPIIQLVVEELVEAGIKDIILVTKWDKKPLEDHFDYNWALQNDLKNAGKYEKLDEIKKIAELANFIYVRQMPKYGNGVPLLSVKSIVKNEPFIYCYGDDLVKSEVSFSKQMVDEYRKTGHLMIGAQEVLKEEVNNYGIIKLKKESMQMEGIIEKPKIKEAPSNLANFGRMILDERIINILETISPGKDNEIWLVDAIAEFIKQGGEFFAKKIENGEWLTTGDSVSYLHAILKYAMDLEDLSIEIKKIAQEC